MKKALPFFSYLFHPLFIPIFGSVFYFLTAKDKYFSYDLVYLHLIQILIVTVFIPLSIFYLLLHYKKVDSIMVSDVSQRKLPLLINIILISGLIKRYITTENLPELHYFFLGNILSSLLALGFAFFKKKISIHMTAMAGVTVFILGLLYFYQIKPTISIVLLFICNGLVGTSRLEMNAHTLQELILGFLIGLLPQLLLLSFWL